MTRQFRRPPVLQQYNIKQEFIPPCTFQQNGMVGRFINLLEGSASENIRGATRFRGPFRKHGQRRESDSQSSLAPPQEPLRGIDLKRNAHNKVAYRVSEGHIA